MIPVSPDGSLTYSVVIKDQSCQPVVGASVSIVIAPLVESLVCWCDASGPAPHAFTRTTNVAGVAIFRIRASGCLPKFDLRVPGPNHFAAEVFANGVKMQECGFVSPDAVDNGGKTTLDEGGWSPGGACAVGLSDAVFHTTPLALGTYTWCTDINGDNVVSLSDGVLLTPTFANAVSCPQP